MKYRWPWSINSANFVSVRPWLKAKGSKNFSHWREQMLSLLEGQDVLGFVDGRIPPPPPPPDDDHDRQQDYKLWRRTDRLVKGWILGSIGKDALDAVSNKETARDVWLEMHTIFNRKDTIKEVELSSKYLDLYKAAKKGDWETFVESKEEATAIISSESETALHVAVKTGKANDFVKKMVELMSTDELALQNSDEDTALHYAAMVGNMEAAEALVNKNPDLLYILNGDGELPILIAAINCQKETLQYLKSVSEPDVNNSPFQGKLGVELLCAVITSEYFDVALDLLYEYPDLARMTMDGDDDGGGGGGGACALSIIAEMRSVFPSGESFSRWQNFIYYLIHPVPEQDEYECKAGGDSSDVDDIESSSSGASSNQNRSTYVHNTGFTCIIWRALEYLIPQVKEMRCRSAKHEQARRLVNKLCKEMASLPEKEAASMFLDSILRAAENGISEIVKVIMEVYPPVAFASEDETGKDVFLWAATNRYEKVFNLIYSLSDHQLQAYDSQDNDGNNLMHVCGILAPPDRLNLVPGAALQMQRELQWFKEMKKFVHPSRRAWKNDENLTPKMLFTKQHLKLKEEGEKWMKETATACNIAAALIATVMFAAAFTPPGGVEKGVPVFVGKFAFHVFAVSDAISLFSSITSLLMFLSILASRYAEEDFLYVLPKRLTLGLVSLFVSISFMMVTFCAAMYLTFRAKLAWMLIPVAAFACLPVTSFVLLQFPLLVDVVHSTYGPGIFGKDR